MKNDNTASSQARVALLIDMDNISDKHAEQIYKYAAAKGNVTVRRGYGVMNYGWNKDAMLQYAIEPVVRWVNVAGKNVTDIALVIDALGLAYQKTVDVVCIASNDSDFSPLAMKLRELAISVYGIGTAAAQSSFVSSCDSFLRLLPDASELFEKNNKPGSANVPTVANVQKIDKMKNVLRDACGHCENESGWALVANVGVYVRRIYPDFSPKDYGYEKFSLLIKATEFFEYDESEWSAHKIRIKDGNSN